LKFGETEFGENQRNRSNWSNFCMLLRRAGLTASAGFFSVHYIDTICHTHLKLCHPRCEQSSHWRRSDTAWKQNCSIPALPDCLTALSTCVSLV